jgi:hypothetical protein
MKVNNSGSQQNQAPRRAAAPEPVLEFLQNPNLTTFRQAFPYLVGHDLSFSEWLELNHDSLPEPESLSEWIATIHNAISPEGPGPSEHSTRERR